MCPNPDDRSDNVQKLQENINNTLKNINLANDVIAKSDDPKEVQNMRERNEKRAEALDALRSEIREEAIANKNNMH